MPRCPIAILCCAGALGGCIAEEDHGPFRPGGGGGTGGGSNQGGDARLADAAGTDGGGGVSGLVCVVTDLRAPDACPAVASRAGVTIAVTGTTTTTTSDTDGRFAVALSGGIAVLGVAAGSATLERSRVPVAATTALVHTPVVTRPAWAAVLGALGVSVPDGGGVIALYVDDTAGPAAGVTFAAVAGSSIAPFYDDGGALAWTQLGGTGVAGVALFVDVPVGNVTLDGAAADQRVARLTGVPVVADEITFVRVRLAAPP